MPITNHFEPAVTIPDCGFRDRGESLVWYSEQDAQGVIYHLMGAYLDGASVQSSSLCAYTEDHRLHLSFGRQKGHSTAAFQFMLHHPELDFILVVPRRDWTSHSYPELHRLPNCRVATMEQPEYGLQGLRVDVAIIDTSRLALPSGGVPLLQTVQRVAGHTILLCSDVMEFHSFGPREVIEVSVHR